MSMIPNSVNVAWDCIWFQLNETNNTQFSSNYCATGWAASQTGGSNWRPANATGISNVDLNEMNLMMSPNPSNGLVNLVFIPQSENMNVEIRNSIGQVTAKFQFTSQDTMDGQVSLDLSDYDLSSGIYFVSVNSGHRTQTQKLIYTK